MISREYFVDYHFNTIDFCALLFTDDISLKYKKIFTLKVLKLTKRIFNFSFIDKTVFYKTFDFLFDCYASNCF